jgi:hypothetical protein
MHQSLTFFFQLTVYDLDAVMGAFTEDFDTLLKDAFVDKELEIYSPQIDALAATYVQPVLEGLTFEDFTSEPQKSSLQKEFFSLAKSSLCLENVPFLETNPFQVTYFNELLKRFDQVLIDRGGVSELSFKEDFLKSLESFKTIDDLTPLPSKATPAIKHSRPVDPIDFLVQDVYDAFARLKINPPSDEDLNPKVRQIYRIIQAEQLNSDELFRKSGLNAKDFDDGLERLKFWLRKH